jgi:copper chaperone CopZ
MQARPFLTSSCPWNSFKASHLCQNLKQNIMKKIFLFIALASAITTNAQVNSVSLQASGLTCSMCSNAINKSLKTLDFVQKVDADIKTYTFQITFKPNTAVDFDKIKNKVESAGFTVCGFVANIRFDNDQIKKGELIKIQDKALIFIDGNDHLLNGDKQIKIMDKGFVSANVSKKYSFLPSLTRTYHVSL